jgi:transcriptional regulator with PAS, ATPase and Fis domain
MENRKFSVIERLMEGGVTWKHLERLCCDREYAERIIAAFLEERCTETKSKTSEASTLKEEMNKFEAERVRETLSLCGNNISRAAKLLKISRPSLYSRIKKYNIDTSEPHRGMRSR